MDIQIQKVKELKEEYYMMYKVVDRLKTQMEEEINTLKKQCPHDEFYKEDDGDYHSPGYYYTCTVCGFFTKCRPCRPNSKVIMR